MYYFDSSALWQQVSDDSYVEVGETTQTRAKELNIRACHVCHQLTNDPICNRCHSQTYMRNNQHLQWVLAFSLTSLVCYIPANFSPLCIHGCLP